MAALGIEPMQNQRRNKSPYTDILVNVNFMCIWCCPIFLISHQIHGTPNTRLLCVFPQLGGRKNVHLVWSNLYPLNYVLLVFLANQNLV